MTKITQKVAEFIFLILFVSSFSPVVAPRNSSSSQDPPKRILKGTVYVNLPEDSTPPDSIVVILKGDHDPRMVQIPWSAFSSSSTAPKYKKHTYRFEFTSGIWKQSFTLGVQLGDGEKLAQLPGEFELTKNTTITKNIKYDLTKDEPIVKKA